MSQWCKRLAERAAGLLRSKTFSLEFTDSDDDVEFDQLCIIEYFSTRHREDPLMYKLDCGRLSRKWPNSQCMKFSNSIILLRPGYFALNLVEHSSSGNFPPG